MLTHVLLLRVGGRTCVGRNNLGALVFSRALWRGDRRILIVFDCIMGCEWAASADFSCTLRLAVG